MPRHAEFLETAIEAVRRAGDLQMARFGRAMQIDKKGTIDLVTPATDTQASITTAERQTWWTAFEAAGTNTGFLYSLIGGGDRLSSAEPGGASAT